MRTTPICASLLVLGALGCGQPDVPSNDDGSVTPLEPGEAEALADVFLEARATRGGEACRCAGDVAFCEAETIPPIDMDDRACLIARVALGGVAFRETIPCLQAAADAYADCGASFTCPEVPERMACLDAYASSGAACFAGDPALAGLLAACLPETAP